MKRLDLAEVVLTLKAGGITDLASFPWLEAPDARALERAENLLVDLGALTAGGGFDRLTAGPAEGTRITELGRRMLRFPVHPRYARMFVAAQERDCVRPVALMAALIHAPRILFLDEPFEGIDPVTSRTIKAMLLALQERGVTLVLTSHILEVVEKLCPLIAILDGGRIKGFGRLDELRADAGEQSLEALFVGLVGGVKAGELSWL